MKRTVKIILTFLLTIPFFQGCEKNGIDESATQDTFQKEWYEIVSIDTVSNLTLAKEILGTKMLIGPDIVKVVFLYHSLSDTVTSTLSGSVCWPIDIPSCSHIWLENHITTLRKDQCPSQSIMPGMYQTSADKAIYIGADFQGLGLSLDLPIPYFNTILLADQSTDCFKAAFTILKEMGPSLTNDYQTYNFGYSLGGAVSLAVARRIERSPQLQKMMHLTRSYCGDGPYDQVTMMEWFASRPDQELVYPALFPCAVKSVLCSSPSFRAQYNESDLLSVEFMNSGISTLIDSKDYTTAQICTMMLQAGIKTYRTVMSQALQQDSSIVRTEFTNELEKLNLTTGWTPSVPILFFHALNDYVVPIECLERIKTNMPDNPNITYVVKNTGDHNSNGTEFYKIVFFGY